MKIISLADVELDYLYTSGIKMRFPDCDMVISCGDLPFYYLDYISSTLNRPLYFVFGNHHNQPVLHGFAEQNQLTATSGIDLHCRNVRFEDELLLAGVEGCLRYNNGSHQYTQDQMWRNVFSLIPGLFFNRMKYGRFIDLFVTHATPWQIHDEPDRAHVGIKAFRWFDQVFKPQVHLHGHIHLYRNDAIRETQYCETRVINTYGYRQMEFVEGKFL